MLIVTEADARSLVSLEEAIGLVEAAFIALEQGRSKVFPVALGHGSDAGNRFGLKLAFDGDRGTAGFKLGSYWPGNPAGGVPAHASTTVFLDDATGFPAAIVGASHLTALRTAAADAVAVRHLARADAETVAIVGAGHQAFYDLLAVRCVRQVRRVLVASRNAVSAERFAARARAEGFAAEIRDAAEAVAEADIVVTATPAKGALFDAGRVRPGTHVSAMGADGPGKQELDVALVARAERFADVPAQSVVVGEFQHAARAGLIDADGVVPIGRVAAGGAPGRGGADAITVFDSSGIALQDLAICGKALDRARKRGLAREIEMSR